MNATHALFSHMSDTDSIIFPNEKEVVWNYALITLVYANYITLFLKLHH